MTSKESLLTDVKRAIVGWGGDLRRSYGDNHGQYAIRFAFRGETFIGVAKQYADRGQASFMQQVTHRAAGQEVYLVEFFGSEPGLGSAYVFEPETVIQDGRESQGASKKDIPTDWYEVSLDHGVLLGDYISGRAVPPEPSTSGSRRVTIQDYA